MKKSAEDTAFSMLDGPIDLNMREWKILVAAGAVIDAQKEMAKQQRKLLGNPDQAVASKALEENREKVTDAVKEFKSSVRGLVAFEVDSISAAVGRRIEGLEDDVIKIIESHK